MRSGSVTARQCARSSLRGICPICSSPAMRCRSHPRTPDSHRRAAANGRLRSLLPCSNSASRWTRHGMISTRCSSGSLSRRLRPSDQPRQRLLRPVQVQRKTAILSRRARTAKMIESRLLPQSWTACPPDGSGMPWKLRSAPRQVTFPGRLTMGGSCRWASWWLAGRLTRRPLYLKRSRLQQSCATDLTAGSGPSPDLALTDTPRLCTAIDQVLGSRLLWLQRYGISEEVARRRGADLKDRLTAAARSARHDQEEKIRTSPILPAAVDKLRTEARAAFHAADITSKLLSWAGNPPSTTSRRQVSGVCLFASASAPRSIFIGEDDSDLAAIGGWLGGTIAQALLGYLLIRALECTEARSISPADSAVKVRDAIAEIRDRPPTGKAHPSAKIVIIIPDVPYDLRKDIGVTGTDADAWRSEDQRREREQIAEELGLTGSSLALQLAGSIDGVPVIKTRVSVKRIVILDMARLGKLYLAADDKAAPAEPGLVLIGPVQAGTAATVTRGSGTSQNSPSAAGVNTDPGDSVPAEQNHDDTLQVKMRSWLPLEFSTSDPAASRTLTWDEWQ